MVTVREIAKRAGVAASTVSLVLNDKPGVRKEVRERITGLLLENGYQIRKNREEPPANGEIRFIRYLSRAHCQERNEDFFAGLLNGAEHHASKLGYRLSLSSVTPVELPELFSRLQTQADLLGVIFLASELEEEQIPHLLQFSRPMVTLDMPAHLEHYPINGINTDNVGGIFSAMQYLYACGHRAIGFLRAETEIGGLSNRYLSYCHAMEQLGLKMQPNMILNIDPQYKVAVHQVQAYLQGHPALPTVFMAANDIIAAGCVRALQQAGYQVPDDISVMGFDDGAMSTFTTPPLTTMRINRTRLGELAVERLIAVHAVPDDVIVKSTISVSLVQRESVRSLK